MVHPLYYTAARCSGKPVFLYHNSGRVYHGTLVSVAPHGVYIVQHPPGTVLTSSTTADAEPGFAADDGGDTDVSLTYSPMSYFAFGALTGLTLGAVAGRYWW